MRARCPPSAFANSSLTEKDKAGLTFGLQANGVLTSTNAICFGGGGGVIGGFAGVGNLFRQPSPEQTQTVFNSGQFAAEPPISPPVVDAVTGLTIASGDQNGSVTTFGGSNAGGVLTDNEKDRFLLAQGNRQPIAGAATKGFHDSFAPIGDNSGTSKLGVANAPNSSFKVDGVASGSATFSFEPAAPSTVVMSDDMTRAPSTPNSAPRQAVSGGRVPSTINLAYSNPSDVSKALRELSTVSGTSFGSELAPATPPAPLQLPAPKRRKPTRLKNTN